MKNATEKATDLGDLRVHVYRAYADGRGVFAYALEVGLLLPARSPEQARGFMPDALADFAQDMRADLDSPPVPAPAGEWRRFYKAIKKGVKVTRVPLDIPGFPFSGICYYETE